VKTVHIIFNAHIDPVWIWDWHEGMHEVLQTFHNEGTREEVAYLLRDSEGAILVYIMDVADPTTADLAFRYSSLPIDQQHKQVMHQVLGDAADAELLYDVRLPGR